MRTGARLADRFVVGEPLPAAPGRTRWRARDERGGAEVEVWAVPVPGAAAPWLAAMAKARIVPGLRRVVDCGAAPGLGWVAYQAAAPGPRVDPARPMPIEHVIGWARAVTAGLDATHRAGWAHGALNVDDVAQVGPDLRIAGVGVWSALPPGALATAWGGDGWQLAPEVRAGGAATAASDVWALTLGAARLALGDLRDRAAVVAARAPIHGPALVALYQAGLADDPGLRPTMTGFVDALVAIARTASDAGAPEVRREPAAAALEPDAVTVIGDPPAADAAVSAPGLIAVSRRPPELERPRPAAPPAAEPVRPRVQLLSIADALPPGFETRPGALGYLAPPVIRGAVPIASARRWRVIVAVAVTVVAIAIALMVGFA